MSRRISNSDSWHLFSNVACIVLVVACAVRSLAANYGTLAWLAAGNAHWILTSLLALSFGALNATGFCIRRQWFLPLVSLAGVAFMACGGLLCDANCAANCTGKGTSAILSLFGAAMLAISILEHDKANWEYRSKELRRSSVRCSKT